MDVLAPERMLLPIEIPEPRRTNARIDKAEPKCTKLITDNADPILPRDLTLIPLPNLSESKIEQV